MRRPSGWRIFLLVCGSAGGLARKRWLRWRGHGLTRTGRSGTRTGGPGPEVAGRPAPLTRSMRLAWRPGNTLPTASGAKRRQILAPLVQLMKSGRGAAAAARITVGKRFAAAGLSFELGRSPKDPFRSRIPPIWSPPRRAKSAGAARSFPTGALCPLRCRVRPVRRPVRPRPPQSETQNSTPFCALMPSRNGCLTSVISVTRSAASISSGLALRPVRQTWVISGFWVSRNSTTSSMSR